MSETSVEINRAYTTLLQRGMPKIDGLGHINAREGVNDQFVFAGRYFQKEWARDLIAMHALRWIYEHPNAHNLERYVREWSVCYGIGKYLPAPDDILRGVLHATQFMEPAGAPA